MRNLIINLQRLFYSRIFRFFITLFCTLVGTIGAVELFKFFVPDTVLLTNNILFCVVAFLLYLFYHALFSKSKKSKINRLDKRSLIFVFIFAIIFSIILIIGGQLEFYNHIIWTIGTIIKIICVSVLLFPVSYLIIQNLEQLDIKNFNTNPHKLALITFASIFIVTIIVFLFVYPGIYTYDMARQNEIITNCFSTGTCYSGNKSISHWSLSYGLIFAGFLEFGHLVFHNYEAGMAIAMFVQMLFVCYVETRIVLFTTKYSHSKLVYILSTLFFCLMPFLVIMSLSAAQDVLFGGLFALIFLNLFDALFDNSYFKHKINFVKIPLLSFLMCTVRGNGVYCLIFLLIFIFLFVRRKYTNITPPHFKRNLIILILIPIIAAFLYDGPFLKALHIEKTSSLNEILGIPSQQLARAYFQTPNDFTEQELSELSEFYDINDKDFQQYPKYPIISDYTKNSLNVSATSSNLPGYIGLWFSIGIKNPKSYIDAFLLNNLGYWYPNKNYNDPRINLDYINYPGFSMTTAFTNKETHPTMKPVTRHSVNDSISQKIDGLIFQDGWQKKPLYSTFCAISTYILLSVFALCYIWLKRRYYLLMPFGLILGLLLTLLLSPVAIFRYAYPIVILAPCFIAMFYLANHPSALKSAPRKISKKSKRVLQK